MSRIEQALRRAGLGDDASVVEAPVEPIETHWHVDETAVQFDQQHYASERTLTVVPSVPEPVDFDAAAVEVEDAPPPPVDDIPLEAAVVPQEPASPAAAVPDLRNERLIIGGADAVAVEQYRKLAATLHRVQLDRGLKVVMVASAIAGEGKTLTAANLALTLSESFKRSVLLIDADLRRPSVHTVLDLPNGVGLSDGLSALEDRQLSLVQATPLLSVLPAGRPNADPMSGLSSPRMKRIIEEASARFDWVIVDTPPIGLLPDAKLLAEMVDAVLLVIGAGMTPFRAIKRATSAIERERILGVVLNRVVETHADYSYYHYYTYTRGGDRS